VALMPESKHPEDERITWLKPRDDQGREPGWRLRVLQLMGDNVRVYDEQVLPERVSRHDAHRILNTVGDLILTLDDVRWLYNVLSEIMALGPEWIGD